MKASEAPPIEWTTDEILTMLAINTQGARNSIQEDMLTETEGIGHLHDEDDYTEGIQSSCRWCANRTLANGRFVVTRVHFTISPHQNRKEHFTISPQQNGKDHFTTEKCKIAFHHFTTEKWIASRHLIWWTIWERQQMTFLVYTIV